MMRIEEQKMETISLVPAGRGAHNKIKTHCSQGHPLSGDNLYVSTRSRECRLCRRLRNREKNRRKRIAKRTKSMTDIKAQLVLVALRKGRTLNSICCGRLNGRQSPGEKITDYCLFRNYCADHPDYSREALALLAENTKVATAKKGAHLRNLTHCRYGHPLSGPNVRIEEGRWRRCLTCLKRREVNPPLPSEEKIRAVTAALNAGKTIGQICWGRIADKKVEASLLPFRNLKRYRELNPEFNRFVLSIIANSNSRAQRRRHNPERTRIEIVRSETNDYYEIAGMVPRHLPPDLRDDIAQSIFLALLDGSLRRDEVKARVKRFVADQNRDANKHGTGKYGLWSIDAPAYADGSATLGDTISRGLWD
jgi:hypothetical protein